MKKLFLAFVCFLGLSTTSFSQNSTQGKEDIKLVRTKNLEQIEKAAKSAGVDDATTAKLKKIIEELYKTQDEVNADASLTPEQRKEKLNKANALKDWKVKDLLQDKYMPFVEARKKMQAEAAAAKQ